MTVQAAEGRRLLTVVFPDDWAPFSPTLTRLVDALSKRFTVNALVFDSGRFDHHSLDSERYTRVTLHPRLAAIFRRLRLIRVVRTLLLMRQIRKVVHPSVQVIAVDADGVAATWLARRRIHFLSLEIGWHPLARHLVLTRAKSVISQSEERLLYQLGEKGTRSIPTFLIQNSPSIRSYNCPLPSLQGDRPRLVYMGNMIPKHGLWCMLELVRRWEGCTLTLHGIADSHFKEEIAHRYGDLLNSKRLFLSTSYLEDSAIIPFLRNFDIGVCLYETPPEEKADFNYESSPSGKMFNYFAAGLPVLASHHIGLYPVTQFHAGIQASDNHAETLLSAGRMLCSNYREYQSSAIRAGRAFDFQSAVAPFLAFLERSIPATGTITPIPSEASE